MVFDEKELINGCRTGDRSAQKRLYDVFGGKMYAISMRYTKDREDAQDVLQDAFIKVYEHIHNFRGDSPLEFWIRSIVVNTALKHLKKKKNLVDIDDVHPTDFDVQTADQAIAGFQWQQLMEFIQELPHGCQTVFNLFAIEGYKHHEIAEMLNISEGTSKSQFARARALLQQKLNKEHRFDNESIKRQP
jgi:RNA polymerase sigma factor (sigma-70 family)